MVKQKFRCVYCDSKNTIKAGKTYLKTRGRSYNWRQKCKCKDCGKCFTAKRGLVGKIYGGRKHGSTLKHFTQIVDNILFNNERITSRSIQNKMLHGSIRKKVSHVTINEWLKIIYPNIPRYVNHTNTLRKILN